MEVVEGGLAQFRTNSTSSNVRPHRFDAVLGFVELKTEKITKESPGKYCNEPSTCKEYVNNRRSH